MQYKGLGIRVRNIVSEAIYKSFPTKWEFEMHRNVVNKETEQLFDYKLDFSKHLFQSGDITIRYLWK